MDTLTIYNDARRVYPCPQCGEEVDTSLAECCYCHCRLDPKLAGEAASLESKLSKASGSSNIVRMVGGAAIVTGGAGNLAVILGRIGVYRRFSIHRLTPEEAGFCILMLALITFALAIFTVGSAISWNARFRNMSFERLPIAQYAKMQAEHSKAKKTVAQYALSNSFLGLRMLGLHLRVLSDWEPLETHVPKPGIPRDRGTNSEDGKRERNQCQHENTETGFLRGQSMYREPPIHADSSQNHGQVAGAAGDDRRAPNHADYVAAAGGFAELRFQAGGFTGQFGIETAMTIAAFGERGVDLLTALRTRVNAPCVVVNGERVHLLFPGAPHRTLCASFRKVPTEGHSVSPPPLVPVCRYRRRRPTSVHRG